MSARRTLVRSVVVVALALVLAVGGFLFWASVSADRSMARSFETHEVDFPVPFPLDPEEQVAQAGLTDAEAEAMALERARERGRHLVEARYACAECHGADYGGGVMVDAFPIGRLLGPNLTRGQGGVTQAYSVADWDRIVRHGVRPDGRPAVMPSEDFLRMSDQELSDIIVYLESVPPVDHEVPPSRLGPLGRILMARGEIVLSADLITTHDQPHPALPPPAEVTVEFGRHLAGVCSGCHGMELTGGRIAGGDPSWVPAANLTPSGLRGWDYADFRLAMLESRRPDGSEVREPMTFVTPFARNMTEVEMQALWMYLQSLPPSPES
jgi:mono/diheme cytochrome c family protein